MSRFISIENRMVNIDHIVQVLNHEDGFITVFLDNGESIKTGSEAEIDILGSRHVTAIVPCSINLWAKMEQDGKEFDIAAEHLVLTADGRYYPLEASLLEKESCGDVTFKALFYDDHADDDVLFCLDDDDDDSYD